VKRIRALLAWLAAPSRRFVPLFFVYLWILTTLTGLVSTERMQSLLRATAWIDYQILRVFSEEVRLSGIVVSLDGFAVRIIADCTGLFEAVILVAAVFAYQATWRERIFGALAGTTLLYLVNVLRIAFLVLVGRHRPDLFDLAHVYFWQTLLVFFIVVLWLSWIHYFVRSDEASPALRA